MGGWVGGCVWVCVCVMWGGGGGGGGGGEVVVVVVGRWWWWWCGQCVTRECLSMRAHNATN